MAISPILQSVLTRYGLESLVQWATNAIIQGWSEDQVMLELFDRPEFKQRFPAIFNREASGLPPISVDEYLAYEKQITSLASTLGMKLSKAEIDNLLTNDVSPIEAEKRFNIAAAAVYDSDAETRSELERLSGVTFPDLMRYWMDPRKELGALQSQYRMAEIAGAALRSGYGYLTLPQAQRLQEAGLDRNTAERGFAQLASSQELFSPINFGESAIDTNAQIEFLAGNADVATMLEQRAAQRKAEFEGGGGYASSASGFSTGKAK